MIACWWQDWLSNFNCCSLKKLKFIKIISMKRIFILTIGLCAFMTGFAQVDSVQKTTPDTIKIGGMVIIREPGSKEDNKGNRSIRFGNRKHNKQSNLSTNWWILDLGFSNFSDKTDYTSSAVQTLAPGSDNDWLKARAGKSRSVNVWIVMQRLNMIKHVVNLKYGIGLELNNYHFDDKDVRLYHNPDPVFMDESYSGLHKNKLAADYLTVPLMVNFNFTPKKDNDKSFGFSAGVSAGYLYSARQKIKDGKVHKEKGDFDLRPFKLSYIGEITLGPVRLYGSYAFKSMFDNALDVTPYNVGFRFSNW